MAERISHSVTNLTSIKTNEQMFVNSGSMAYNTQTHTHPNRNRHEYLGLQKARITNTKILKL